MKRSWLILFLLLAMYTPVWAGGPWVRSPGKGFAQLGYSGLYYNSVFNPLGTEASSFRSISDHTLQFYAEYGLAKGLEVRAVVPFKILSIGPSTNEQANPVSAGSLSGFGNLGLGLKMGLVDKAVKVSVGVDVLANTFTNNDRLGLRTGFEGWTLLPYLSVGSGTKRTYFYAEAGYGFMTQNYSNFVKLNGEAGFRLLPNLWAGVTLDFRLAEKNGPFFNTEAYQFNATYLNNQQFLGLGVKAAYDLKPERLGISASVIGALAGENVPFSRSYNVGIYIKW
jgi:hypothetical protein